MSKKMRLWMAGTVGVLMAGFMSVSVYAQPECHPGNVEKK